MRVFLILLFFVVLTSAILPFYISNSNLKVFNYSTQIVSTFSSLLTLLIAILLFNKFGIEKSILQRKTEAVIKLLEKLNRQNFLMESPRGILINFFVTSGRNNVKEYWQMYKEHQLLFGRSYIRTISEIEELVEDIFVPKEVVKKFMPLHFSYSELPLKEIKDYLIVIAPPKLEKEYPSILNGKPVALEEYAKNWQVFIDTLQSWLNKNSSLRADLNIFSR